MDADDPNSYARRPKKNIVFLVLGNPEKMASREMM
jgi:hypothetical protein